MDYEDISIEDIQYNAVNSEVKLGKVLGGDGVDDITYEVNDLLDAHSVTLTDEDLLELMNPTSEEEEKEVLDQEEGEDEVGLVIERLFYILGNCK